MSDESRTEMNHVTHDTRPTRKTPPPASAQPPAWNPPAPEIATDTAIDAAALPAPRIRWAAVVWGLALAGIAATALWVVADPARRSAFVEWMLSLSGPAAVAYTVLTVGAFALIAGVVGIARRLQRSGDERRGPVLTITRD